MIGDQPTSKHTFVKLSMNPAGKEIAKIRVCSAGYIFGIKFFDKDANCLLHAGEDNTGTTQDIDLEEGERLVGVKSTLWDNTAYNSAYHCNMVFIIGRLE